MNINLKTTHKSVKYYYSALEKYNELGYEHEGAVKNAFANLIRSVSRKLGYTLIEEYKIHRKEKTIFVDGALIDDFKISHGFWEAKDSQDDLDREVTRKFTSGYPQGNIIFQAPRQAIIIQNGSEVFNKNLDNPEHLIEAFQIFFSYQPPFHEEWQKAVEEFKDKVPNIAQGILKLIDKERQTNKGFIEAFDNFTSLCRRAINPNLSLEAIEEMLIQHILTVRIFSKIFNNPEFANKNIIAHEIEKVIDALTSHYFNKSEFLKPLDPFYVAIENTASTISDYSEKQSFLNTVYEKFFQGFSVKVADTHGIVYTPQPIVNFIVNSVEDILQKEFNRSLSDEDVHILDPFVGTGNFIIRVMRKIKKTALPYKYAHELHCNEVMLLPYYIASMNIEHEYYHLTNDYQPFPGICLVDTFELAEPQQISFLSEENTERVEYQKKSPIFVILGNPPYNAGQVNENDNNKNRKYPVIDDRVKETYSKDSKATYVADLDDPYIKAFRWASDRIGKEGIVAFVTNNNFFDGIAFDGIRKHMARDFNTIYHLDLGGNVRKNPKLSGTTHNVFGIQVGVGISLFIKKIESTMTCTRILYHRVDEYWRKEQKYDFLAQSEQYNSFEYEEIAPNSDHTWLTAGLHDEFANFIPMGTKEAKRLKDEQPETIFKLYSLGVATNRDAYVYNFNLINLITRVKTYIEIYNTTLDKFRRIGVEPSDIIDVKDSRIKWTRQTKASLGKFKDSHFIKECLRISFYRPFTEQYLYFNGFWNEEQYQQRRIFPDFESEHENLVIIVPSLGSKQSVFHISKHIVDLNYFAGSTPVQCFPYYTYDKDGRRRRENITGWALEQFQSHYKDSGIKKWDIFYYVYGLLHNPEYRDKYAANLRRELPRIPFADDFRAFAKAGEILADLHINYEQQEEYPLREIENPEKPLDWRVEKMKLSKDKKSIIYNDFLTLEGIPEETFEYRLGNRSALEWIIDQYRVKTDKRSGIVSDPNNENAPDYIVRLIKKIITVSVETVKIVNKLPKISKTV